jgi:hypothetical protein
VRVLALTGQAVKVPHKGAPVRIPNATPPSPEAPGEGAEGAEGASAHGSTPFDHQRTDDGAFSRALEVQRHVPDAGFHRALSLPDLLVAATAEFNRLTVLPTTAASA